MLGSLILYLKGMRRMMFQLSGFYSRREWLSWNSNHYAGMWAPAPTLHSDWMVGPGKQMCPLFQVPTKERYSEKANPESNYSRSPET